MVANAKNCYIYKIQEQDAIAKGKNQMQDARARC
jgi:hypothetical protein